MADNDMDLFNRLENGGNITKQDTGSNGGNNSTGTSGLRTLTESADGLKYEFFSRDGKKKE